MSYLNPKICGSAVSFDMQECIAQGQKLRDPYTSASPFPHIVVDSFLPIEMLHQVVTEFPVRKGGDAADPHSLYKRGYTLDGIKSAYITNLLSALNSAQFLRFLEEMTGIEGLISDPYYVGGGLHETSRGGHLSVHADFNVQKKLGLLRRLNLILYLNDDWRDEYGGHLELWHRDMSGMAHRIAPTIARAVVFNTDEDSYHGHPDPLTSPPDVYRRSIALYYYTAPIMGLDKVRKHTTQFKARPGTADRPDYRTRLNETLRDLCPPVLWRWMRQLRSSPSGETA